MTEENTSGKGPPPLPPRLPLPVAPMVVLELSADELKALKRAKRLLENPGFTARLANRMGRPIEAAIGMLPGNASEVIRKATRAALIQALDWAVVSLGRSRPRPASQMFHKILVGASGGMGGAFGLAAIPVELPLSTTLMLRSIADIARSEGHHIRDLSIKLSCLEVFALGGNNEVDDATESSYWAVRAALAKAITEAVGFLAERGVVEHSAPAVLKLIAAIATRFGVIVTEQVAAKAVPIIGAAGGSMINVLFMNHFQDMARGHFIVKRLETRYGREYIREIYMALPSG